MRTTGSILIVSLLALSVCGVLMACMDSFGHFAVLSGGTVPSAITWLSVMLVSLTASVAAALATITPSIAAHRNPPPDIALWHPLQPAFSDGLLNPKPF